MRGLSNQSRYFLFLFLNDLLPTKERLHRTTRNTPSPVCSLCQSGEVDSSHLHTFTTCQYTAETMRWLVERINLVDPACTTADLVRLQFVTMNSDDTLAVTWLTGETLSYAWARRQNRQVINLGILKAELTEKVVFFTKSKYSSNRAAGETLVQLLN